MRRTRPLSASARSRWAVRESPHRASTAAPDARPRRPDPPDAQRGRFVEIADERLHACGRSSAMRAALEVSAIRRQRPRSSAATRRPCRRSRRSAALALEQHGRSIMGAKQMMNVRAKSRTEFKRWFSMSFTVTVQPSGRVFQRRSRRADSQRRKFRQAGPALRLQGRRLRLVQVPVLEGRVIHGVHQSKALSAEEEHRA